MPIVFAIQAFARCMRAFKVLIHLKREEEIVRALPWAYIRSWATRGPVMYLRLAGVFMIAICPPLVVLIPRLAPLWTIAIVVWVCALIAPWLQRFLNASVKKIGR